MDGLMGRAGRWIRDKQDFLGSWGMPGESVSRGELRSSRMEFS